jgi:hypothetical protein
MPYPDFARWVSAAMLSGRKTAAPRLRAGLQALRHRAGLNEDFLYLFTFAYVSNTGIFVTIFT